VKISELAARANVPLTAVKYYQREDLLPSGERLAANQVSYGERHVQRLRLVRALIETGGLSVAATKEVIRTLDSEQTPLAETFSVAQHAMSSPRTTESNPSAASRQRVLELAEAQGWTISVDNPGIDAAARALDGLRAIDFEAPADYLRTYAAAAASVASADVALLTTLSHPDQIAELMVIGTVLGDPMFAGLRRLAHENSTHQLFPTDPKAVTS
jgi:DNA-binding transcriptional MerR regulator